jgi:hypothetical protein
LGILYRQRMDSEALTQQVGLLLCISVLEVDPEPTVVLAAHLIEQRQVSDDGTHLAWADVHDSHGNSSWSEDSARSYAYDTERDAALGRIQPFE